MKDERKRSTDTNPTILPIYYDKRISTESLYEHKHLLFALACSETTHGANVEKLKNHHVYSIRTNKKGRILFTYHVIKGVNHIVILEILKNHKYETSKFLQKHVLVKYLEKNQVGLERITDEDFEGAELPKTSDMPNSATMIFTPAHENNGTYIVLDEMQETSLSARTPLLIEGPPGSGKTSLAVVLLKQAVENNQRVLYVTQSPFLADKIKAEWMASPGFEEGKAQVSAYQALDDLQAEGKKTFENWFTQFLKEKIKDKKIASRFYKEIDKVYEEFRIISGYSKEEYTSKENVGQKQSLYKEANDRNWLYTVFNLWKLYLQSNNIKLSEFFELGDKFQAKYDLVIVDESQDFSHGQLRNLSKLAKNKNIVYCIDPRQNLHDENPKLIYLKKLLTNSESMEPPTVVQLSTHYRCSKNIMDFALVFNQLRIELGPKNKTETKIADSQILGGIVEWLDPLDKSALSRLHEMRNDANVCVVTQKEFVQEVKEKLGITQVFTPEQVKGLEYSTVVLYKILNTTTLREVNKVLGQRVASENEMFSSALSACFVGATRAIDALYVVQNEDRLNNHIVKKLKEKIPAQIQAIKNAVHESTKEEWEAKAKALALNGNLEQARSIIKNHLDIQDEMKLNNLLSMWGFIESPSVKELENEKENISTSTQSTQQTAKRRKKSRNKKVVAKSNGISNVNNAPKKKVEVHFDFNKNCMFMFSGFSGTNSKQKNKSPELLAPEEGVNSDLSPMLRAARDGDETLVSIWLQLGADPNYRGDLETSLLHQSAMNGHTKVVKMLVAAGANPNLQDDSGATPLHLAIMNGHIDTAQTFLSMDTIDINLKTKDGKTALDFAHSSYNAKTSLVKHLSINANKEKLINIDLTREQAANLLPMLNLTLKDQNPHLHISVNVKEKLLQKGFQYTEVPADNHCLYHAVGIFVEKQAKELRLMVADYIEKNIGNYHEIILGELQDRSMKSIEDYIKGIKGDEWAGDLEISVLSTIFNRPIQIYGKEGEIINEYKVASDGKLISLYYNGDSHYDALIASRLLNKNEEKRSVCAR